MPATEAASPARGVGLSREIIVATAVELARAEGIESLTMRRLADRLGCGAMSLYRHVPDRRALCVAMLDAVAQGLRVPPQDDPRAEIAAIMTAIHAAFLRDPWIVRVLIFEGSESLDILPLVDRLFAALFGLGLGAAEAASVYAVLIQHAYGAALDSTQARDADRIQRLRRAVEDGGYRHVARAFAETGGAEAIGYADQLGRLIRGLT
jgi:AcrR family transcriptional regulator